VHEDPLVAGAVLEQGPARLLADAAELPVVAQRLGKAAYRQLVHRHRPFGPLRHHARPADPREAQLRAPGLERGHEVRPQLIARGLAGDDRDVGRASSHGASG